MEIKLMAEMTALRVVLESLIRTLPRASRRRVAEAFEEHAALVEGLRLNSRMPDEAVNAQHDAMEWWRDVFQSIDVPPAPSARR